MNSNHTPVDPNLTAGSNKSYWIDSIQTGTRCTQLSENADADVVIIGGGIAGMSIAYCLSRSGKKIILVDDGYLGSGETGRTTAHLVAALDDRYYDLQDLFGESDLKLIAASHNEAIDFIESTVKNEKIDCGFRRLDGYLFLHPTDKKQSLEKEFEAAKKAGLDVELINHVYEIPHEKGISLRYRNQAQFHPLHYLIGLKTAIQRMGGKIYTETHAEDINHEGIVTREGFTVKADHIVVATNTPVNNLVTMHLKQYAYRTYVIGKLIPKGMLQYALWWDTGDQEKRFAPYHYVRLQEYDEQHDLLICGGEDHPVGNTREDGVPEEHRYSLLEAWSKKRFPDGEVVYRWSGQVMEPMDSLAFIGRNPWDKDNMYIVTGDSGNGMTHGTISGMLIADLINEKDNKYEHIYKPSRLKIKRTGTMVKEIASSVISVLKDMPAEATREISQLENGEGKIIHINDEKCAVSRDNEGRLHILNPHCTHLRAIVAWNKDEQTWDCPWHGSRFDCRGKVLNGPANIDMKKSEE